MEIKMDKNFRRALSIGFSTVALSLGVSAHAKDTKDISVAVVPNVAVPFFDDCNKGAQTSADKLGVKYQWVVPQNTQGSTQVQIIEDLISKHVDGIAISVNEPKSVESVMKRAAQSGIRELTYDSDSPKSGRSMYIGTNNEAAGATMAETMGKALGGNGEVAIVTRHLGLGNLNASIGRIK